MRYVTFYWDMLHGIADYEEHADKETALKNFNRNYKRYFQLWTKFKADKLPASYGYPQRKYYGMSIRMFNKHFKEEAGA